MVDSLLFCATLTGRKGGHTHLCKQELKRPTPVRRRLRGPTPFLGGSFKWVSDAGVGDESTESCRVVRPLCFPLVFRPLRPTPMLLLSDNLMSCFLAGINGCFDFRLRASPLDGRVSAEWNRCPGSMAWRARDSVAPLRRSSAGLHACEDGWVVRWCWTQCGDLC